MQEAYNMLIIYAYEIRGSHYSEHRILGRFFKLLAETPPPYSLKSRVIIFFAQEHTRIFE